MLVALKNGNASGIWINRFRVRGYCADGERRVKVGVVFFPYMTRRV